MQGYCQDKVKVPGSCGRKIKESIPDRQGLACHQAITAVCTGFSRLSCSDILGSQGVIFTYRGAFHAAGAGLVYVHPERIDVPEIIDDSTNGTIVYAMDHFPPFCRKKDDQAQTGNPEDDSNDRSVQSRYLQ